MSIDRRSSVHHRDDHPIFFFLLVILYVIISQEESQISWLSESSHCTMEQSLEIMGQASEGLFCPNVLQVSVFLRRRNLG